MRQYHLEGVLSWLETFALVGVALGLSAVFRPEDPLFINGAFPWPMIAPLLAALRYGFAHGLAASLLLFIGGAVLTQGTGVGIGIEYAPLLGTLCATLLAGEFRDGWARRLLHLERTAEYSQTRLGEFTRAYHLLRLSHDRLEQRLAGSSRSLREAILRLRRRFGGWSAEGGDPLERSGDEILELVADYGSLASAALYRVDDDGAPVMAPLATMGEEFTPDADDPVLAQALSSGDLVSVAALASERRHHHTETNLVAAIPLTPTSGPIRGVIAVRHMPFFALTGANLKLLAVLGGHIADALDMAEVSGARSPEAQPFLRELRRAETDAKRHNLASVVAAVHFPSGELARQVVALMEQNRRGLDSLWQTAGRRRQKPVLGVLLPLTDAAGFEGYRDRVRALVKDALNQSADSLGVNVRSLEITRQVDSDAVDRFLALNGLADAEALVP